MQNKIDPISAATALASVLFGPDLAHFIGPYAVILLSSTVGAGWALGRQSPMTKWSACWYFSRLNVMAVMLTVPMSAGVVWAFEMHDANWTLAPIALLIGGVGNDWPAVGKWLVSRLGRLFEQRTGTGDTQKNGD